VVENFPAVSEKPPSAATTVIGLACSADDRHLSSRSIPLWTLYNFCSSFSI
jgi:hypothetical protein